MRADSACRRTAGFRRLTDLVILKNPACEEQAGFQHKTG